MTEDQALNVCSVLPPTLYEDCVKYLTEGHLTKAIIIIRNHFHVGIVEAAATIRAIKIVERIP